MQRAHEAVSPQSIELRREHATSSSAPAAAPDGLDPRTLLDLWLANIAAYGPKWTSRAGELPFDDDGRLTIAGGVWSRGLAGMSRDAVLRALERHARVSAWPAELSEMRALCLGVPTLAEVRVMLQEENARKPAFVVLMFQHLDYYNWRHGADVSRADRMLRDAYEVAREHVMLGGELPKVEAAIEHEKQAPKPASPGAAGATFAEAREAFGTRTGKDAAAGPDA
jgi:hypothetical protein